LTNFVYLLSTYNEHGSEDVRATLDKTKVRSLFLKHYALSVRTDHTPEVKEHFSRQNKEALNKLEKILSNENMEASPDPINLYNGWGGPQLHIVELE
jgi:hypothetical protein